MQTSDSVSLLERRDRALPTQSVVIFDLLTGMALGIFSGAFLSGMSLPSAAATLYSVVGARFSRNAIKREPDRTNGLDSGPVRTDSTV